MFSINKGLSVWRMLSLTVVFVLGILSILATSDGDDTFFDPFGIADAGPDQHVGVYESVQLDGSGSNTALGVNPGDNHVEYSWEIVGQPTGYSFWTSDTNIINPTFQASPDPGEYFVQLKVRHGGHAGIDTVKITSYRNPDDILPVANAGADIVAKHGALVELNASDSFQLRGNSQWPLTYSWFMTESPLDSSSSLSSTEVVNPSFIAEFNADNINTGKSHYQVRLHVINEYDWVSIPDHVNVYVYPSEGYVHPTPIAGPDQRVSTGIQVNLDGSESFDVDGRPLSHEWQFYSRPLGSHAVLSNSSTSTPSFTPDVDGAYVIFLSVDNGEYNSSDDLFDNTTNKSIYDQQYQDRVTVVATSSRPEPVSILGPDQRVPYTGPGSLVLDASRTTSSVTEVTSYYWLLINKPATSTATIVVSDRTDPNGAQLNYDMEGDYVVRMRARNVSGMEYDTIVYKVTTNTPPVADAGADQDVTANSLVTLNGSASSDSDLDPVAYSWSLTSSPADWVSWPGDWPLLSDGMTVAPTFTPDLNGEYQLRLTVNDAKLSSVADEVLITVSGSAENSAPTADAGVNQSVEVGETVLLDGGGSSDPESDSLSYIWTVDRPLTSAAVIDDPGSETPSFVADVEGSYDIKLIVNDGLLNSTPDTMTVTAATTGACANPLTLMTTLPFAPNTGEMATNIRIDAEGVNTLSAITASAIVDADVYQARIPDSNNMDQAEFVLLLPAVWEEVSRSHANPISDSDSPSFVVRNITDNVFYQINVDFTGTIMLEVQIDELSGCRCGNSAANCD